MIQSCSVGEHSDSKSTELSSGAREKSEKSSEEPPTVAQAIGDTSRPETSKQNILDFCEFRHVYISFFVCS